MVKTIVSKGNGYNYYWYLEDGSIVEVIKDVVGRFYRAKLILGEGLIKLWTPLTNFTLIE